jgi:hypothetical protein
MQQNEFLNPARAQGCELEPDRIMLVRNFANAAFVVAAAFKFI